MSKPLKKEMVKTGMRKWVVWVCDRAHWLTSLITIAMAEEDHTPWTTTPFHSPPYAFNRIHTFLSRLSSKRPSINSMNIRDSEFAVPPPLTTAQVPLNSSRTLGKQTLHRPFPIKSLELACLRNPLLTTFASTLSQFSFFHTVDGHFFLRISITRKQAQTGEVLSLMLLRLWTLAIPISMVLVGALCSARHWYKIPFFHDILVHTHGAILIFFTWRFLFSPL